MYFTTFLPGINSQSGTHAQRSSTALGLPGSSISITIDGINVQDQDARSTDGFYANVRPQTAATVNVSFVESLRCSSRRPITSRTPCGMVTLQN